MGGIADQVILNILFWTCWMIPIIRLKALHYWDQVLSEWWGPTAFKLRLLELVLCWELISNPIFTTLSDQVCCSNPMSQESKSIKRVYRLNFSVSFGWKTYGYIGSIVLVEDAEFVIEPLTLWIPYSNAKKIPEFVWPWKNDEPALASNDFEWDGPGFGGSAWYWFVG